MNNKLISIPVSLILALFTVICSGVRFSEPRSRLLFIVLLLFWTGIFLAAWRLWKHIRFYRSIGAPDNEKSLLPLSWRGRDIVITAVLLSLSAFVFLFVFYPGVCGADTANQLKDLFTDKPWPFQWYTDTKYIHASLNDHHPVFDTLVFALFYQIGLWTGSQETGMFLYLLFQIAATCTAFSVMLCFMDYLGVPRSVRQAGFWFLALSPFLSMYLINMIKDSLYGVFFVLYMTVYCALILDGAARRRMVFLIILSVILALTKKTGVYLVTLANLALLLPRHIRGYKTDRRLVLVSALLPAFVIFILMGRILFPLLNVYPGGKQEAIGTCMQQVARAVIEHPKEISKEDRAVIDAVMDYSKIEEKYQPNLQDGIKRLYRFDADGKALRDFLLLYLRWIPRYPGSYLKAWTDCVGGYFAPMQAIQVYTGVTTRDRITWQNRPELEELREDVLNIYHYFEALPGLDLLFQISVYVWFLPLLSFFTLLAKKRWLHILCLVPVILSVGVLTLCPYAGFRYALSQVYVLPLVMGLSFMPKKHQPVFPWGAV